MNHEPNNRKWKPGDIVIHDGDRRFFIETVVETDEPDLCGCCMLYADLVGPDMPTPEEAVDAFIELWEKRR